MSKNFLFLLNCYDNFIYHLSSRVEYFVKLKILLIEQKFFYL
jgi:hypothetical protein